METPQIPLTYPVKDDTISQPFGFDNTNHPDRKNFYILFDNKHCRIDFPVCIGTKVLVAYPGIVVRKEFSKGMGNGRGKKR